MHIGGMRTALFNWLFARRHGGQFILRIDDTDRERNMDEALGPILQAFRWLGLEWDEGPEVGGDNGPYFQSQRGELYQAAADRLIAEGKAYRDFDTPDQVAADRAAAEAEKRQYLNIRRSTELDDADIQSRVDRGDKWVLRFLVPRDQKIVLDDEIRGHVEWDAGLISDPVIMRGDGSPLYNFATVIDDAAMNISHVIRAEEHLSNTPTQILLHQALGHDVPKFAHIPYVAAPGSKEKLSKRKLDKYRTNRNFKVLFDYADRVFPKIGLSNVGGLDPVMVEYYEKVGFLPAGLLNALARIGWSLDETTELMSLDFVTEHFTLERVVKGAAGFDPDKLLSYQAHWMTQLSLDERTAGCLPYLQKAGLVTDELSDDQQQFVRDVVDSLADRIKVFSDILTFDYFFRDDIEYSEKDFQKRVAKDGVPELLEDFRAVLADVPEWTAGRLETELQQFCEAREAGTGMLIHALRIGTTGSPTGPGVYDCLVLVGRGKTLQRIDTALERVRADG
jgi:glutamyl-tRNA synthetase